MGEEEKINQKIATLEDEHRSLDTVIGQSSANDRLMIQRLKKRKLWLKDEISRLYSYLHPDIIA
jgi:hypothetical protein